MRPLVSAPDGYFDDACNSEPAIHAPCALRYDIGCISTWFLLKKRQRHHMTCPTCRATPLHVAPNEQLRRAVEDALRRGRLDLQAVDRAAQAACCEELAQLGASASPSRPSRISAAERSVIWRWGTIMHSASLGILLALVLFGAYRSASGPARPSAASDSVHLDIVRRIRSTSNPFLF
jgi:hypothetical protein